MNISENYAIPAGMWLELVSMIKDSRECFGKALAYHLKKRGIQQKALASAVDVDPSTVSRWINEKEVPYWPTLNKVSKFLQLPIAALFTPPDVVLFAGDGKVVFDLEKIAAEAGYIIKKKDS